MACTRRVHQPLGGAILGVPQEKTTRIEHQVVESLHVPVGQKRGPAIERTQPDLVAMDVEMFSTNQDPYVDALEHIQVGVGPAPWELGHPTISESVC